LLAVILLVSASLAQAQELRQEQPPTSHIIQKGTSFRTAYLEYFDSEDPDREIAVVNLNFERGRYLTRRLSLIGGVNALLSDGYKIDHGHPDRRRLNADRAGVGVAGTVRLDVITIGRHNLFIAGRLGFLVCSGQLPPGGTFWNFNQRYVIGVSVRLLTSMNLLLGGNRLHISNGGYKRNPSYDGNGAFIGVTYGF